MINPYSYGWGYVGIGDCDRCCNPSYIFAHSYYATAETRCEGCMANMIQRSIQYNALPEEMRESLLLSANDLPSLSPEKYPFIADTPTCDACQRMEGTGQYQFEEAQVMNADRTAIRTIIVHRRCTTGCYDCDGVIATTNNRMNPYQTDWRVAYNDFIDVTRVDGDNRCEPCAVVYRDERGASDFSYCESCDSQWHDSETRYYMGERYCVTCIEENAFDCDDCGDECWSGNDHYCSNEGDDDGYRENSPIHSYSYRPSPAFFGKGKYYLGFELEVESRNSRYEGAELAQELFGAHVYLKDDGSLNDGFEIVTHPHTLTEYQTNFNWAGLNKLKIQGLRSWNTSTCGLHVHVSREAFSVDNVRLSYDQRILKRQAHELRFMKLIYDNERQVGRIAGRSNNNYATFQDKGKLVRKLKEGIQENGRYSAINTENDATLEVRVFKGSLRPERVLSALEFVTASVEYTRDLPINGKNNALTWLRFTGYVAEHAETYPNLALIMNESFNSDYPAQQD